MTLPEDIRALMHRAAEMQEAIVFTNGCFDIITVGHIEYLKVAKEFGIVIVGLNSDESVRSLKGPARPIVPQEERAEVLRAIRYVDGIVIFDSPRCDELIRAIRPDFYYKCGYTEDTQDPGERQALVDVGAHILLAQPNVGGITTKIMQKLKGYP